MLKNNKAYTLVELMLAISVMGVLLSIAIPMYIQIKKSTDMWLCSVECQSLSMDVKGYLAGTLTAQCANCYYQNEDGSCVSIEDYVFTGRENKHGEDFVMQVNANEVAAGKCLVVANDTLVVWTMGDFDTSTNSWEHDQAFSEGDERCYYYFAVGQYENGTPEIKRIKCKTEGERFLRYAYNYRGESIKDLKIEGANKKCHLIITVQGSSIFVECTNEQHKQKVEVSMY